VKDRARRGTPDGVTPRHRRAGRASDDGHEARPSFTDTDDLWPRVPEFRYRLVAVIGDTRHVLAAAPDGAGIGQAIVTLHEDAKSVGRRLCDEGRIGVLDVLPDEPGHPDGEWIVLPYDRRPA
jgi:hypothetical protein